MGFWKNLRDVLHSPDIVAELEQERTVRQQLSAALSDANNELEKMDTDVFFAGTEAGAHDHPAGRLSGGGSAPFVRSRPPQRT